MGELESRYVCAFAWLPTALEPDTLNAVLGRTQSGERAEKYRQLHLANNLSSRQFILGENIGIVSISIQTARLCNVQDKVTYWEAKNPPGEKASNDTS